MQAILNQPVVPDRDDRDPAIIASGQIFPGLFECRSCNPRKTCLAAQMVENSTLVNMIRRNNRVLDSGEHVYREGEKRSALFVVKSGSIKSYMITEDGEEQVLGFALPGDVLGLDAAGSCGCQSSAMALETSSLCRLPIAQMTPQGLGRGYPALVSNQLEQCKKLVLMLARKDADGRLASLICDLSAGYARAGYSAKAFGLSMSRQDIGSYLGLAIETVSRTLSRFQDGGLILVNRRDIEILDLDKLRSIASGVVAA